MPPVISSAAMSAAIIGGGPSGLMAAEVLSALGYAVDVFDGMPSVGRKFLLAGRGGLNLTHAEPFDVFVSRYSAGSAELLPILEAFDNHAVRDWAEGLGQATFVGTSRRVFPVGMKASPLLRAWLRRLQQNPGRPPVRFHLRHRWIGWRDGQWVFQTPEGMRVYQFNSTVLALGGGSWPRLGSDGVWGPLLRDRGVAVSSLQPSNCGFDVARGWSTHFRDRFAGLPLKSVVLKVLSGSPSGEPVLFSRKGECMITTTGLEGSLIYASSAILRSELERFGHADVLLDLLPDHSSDRVLHEVATPRGSRSLTTHLKSRLGLDGVKLGLLYETLDSAGLRDFSVIAKAIKALPLRLGSPRPLAEAISSAGGVRWESIDERGMLHALPGVFCAGEMLDWDAPTGGYLLTACLATGRWAAHGVHQYLEKEGQC